MIDKEIDALYIGKGNVITSHSIDLDKYNKTVTGTFSIDEFNVKVKK